MSEFFTIGLDLAKIVIQAHGADASGRAAQKTLDISKGQREQHGYHHRPADILAARFETVKRIRIGHLQALQTAPPAASQSLLKMPGRIAYRKVAPGAAVR